MFGQEARHFHRPGAARMTLLPNGHYRRHADGDALPLYDLLLGCTCCQPAPEYAVEYPSRERLIVRVTPCPNEKPKKRGKKKGGEAVSPSTATQPSLKEPSSGSGPSSPVPCQETPGEEQVPQSPPSPKLSPSQTPPDATPRVSPPKSPEEKAASQAPPATAEAEKLVVEVENVKCVFSSTGKLRLSNSLKPRKHSSLRGEVWVSLCARTCLQSLLEGRRITGSGFVALRVCERRLGRGAFRVRCVSPR